MLFYFFIFLFGLCVGSFLNVLIFRLGGKETKIVGMRPGQGIGGRSHCPKCGHVLSWRDLLPVLSFILLRRKCRYCGKKISWQYPIVELATGLLFVFIFAQIFNFSIFNLAQIVFLWFIVSCLVVIFVSDLKYFIIPDEIIIAGVTGALIFRLFEALNFKNWNLFGNWGLVIGNLKTLGFCFLAALAVSVFFLIIVVATKGKGMGFGDVKLVFLMGFVLGWPKILVALLFAFVSGALIGLVLIAAGKAKMKSEIPFGAFLAASTFLVMIWGEKALSAFGLSI